MISTFTIVSFFIAAAATFALPLVLSIVLGVKRKISPLPLFLGAAAFFVSQIILRIPILNALSTQDWFQDFMLRFVFLGLFLIGGLTAGIFEESARLAGALVLKKQRTFKDAVAFGLGHGLCEVVFIVGLVHINNIVFSLAINWGGAPLSLLAAAMPPETLESITYQLTNLNPLLIYFGIFERVCAVLAHIFFTVFVFKSLVARKWMYFVLAVLAHALFNFVVVSLANHVGLWAAGLSLAGMAAMAGLCVKKMRAFF